MNASARDHVVQQHGAQGHAPRSLATISGVRQERCAILHPVSLSTLCRVVRRACVAVDLRDLAGMVGYRAERAALARVYAHVFPEDWRGEVERGGDGLVSGTRAASGVAVRLLEHVVRTDLFPVEEWALDDLQVAADDETEEMPRALSFIPLYPAFGFDWDPYYNGEEEASTGLLLLMALLINDVGLAGMLQETLQTEAEQDARTSSPDDDGATARMARRWAQAQALLDRVTTGEQVAALCADTSGAFARLSEPWASVPLLASYLVADTPNGYLNLTAESWGGSEDYTWTVENVHLLAAEWTQAKTLLERIAATMHLLAQPGAMDILLATLTQTFDDYDCGHEVATVHTTASSRPSQ